MRVVRERLSGVLTIELRQFVDERGFFVERFNESRFREEGLPTFFTLMSFENEAAERRHAQSRYVAHFARKLLPMCDGKPRFTELAYFAGTRKQWTLDKGGPPFGHLVPVAAAHPRRSNGSARRVPAGRPAAMPVR